MKKLLGLTLAVGLVLGLNAVIFAQPGGGMPPQGGPGGMRDGRQDGPDGMRGGKRGGKMRGDKRGGRGERGGMRGDKRGRGFGISDEEIMQLNLTNDQKVKLFDFRKKLFTEREAMRKNMQPGERMNQAGVTPEEMRQLMSAKNLGTLTAEQKAKLDGIEAKRKEMMTKRQSEMQQMHAKREATQQEFLNIFTLDQRKQLETIRAEKFKKMQEMRQNRPDRKGGPNQPKKPE